MYLILRETPIILQDLKQLTLCILSHHHHLPEEYISNDSSDTNSGFFNWYFFQLRILWDDKSHKPTAFVPMPIS